MIRERGNPALHLLDRYAGIPLVGILGRLRWKQTLPAKIESIGLLKSGAIGDTVLMSGPIADLREAFPRARLIFFSGNSNYEIAEMLEGIDRVVNVPLTNLRAGLTAMRSVAVDVMLDFGSWSRTEAMLSVFASAKCKIGFRTPGQHRHYGYDFCVEHSDRVHELENYRRLLQPLRVGTGRAPFLRDPHIRRNGSQGYAAFHLWPGGSRKELKQWPLERWLLLVDEFAKWGIQVVLTGSPSDRDANDQLIARTSSVARGFVRNGAGVTLKETCAILARASLVVSVDTGLMHMAAALGVPLVALHGPSSSARWGPVSEEAVVIEASAEGCGYISLGWERPARRVPCMECIPWEAVRDACHEVLQKGSGSANGKVRNSAYAVASEG